MVLDFRTGDAIRTYVDGADVARYSQTGVVTPDHNIRTKNFPLLIPAPAADALDEFKLAVQQAVDRYVADYHVYFARNNVRLGGRKDRTRPGAARGVGAGFWVCLALGKAPGKPPSQRILRKTRWARSPTRKPSGASTAFPKPTCSTLNTGRWNKRSWPRVRKKPMAGQVVAVTGGGGGIGAAIAAAFVREGAEVAILDVDPDAAAKVANRIGGLAVTCDVTSADSVQAAFAAIVARYGGVDVVASNAGAAWRGRIGDVNDATLRQSFELNFFGHQMVAQAAVKIMRAQDTGGGLLFNTSKQAVNPGQDFGHLWSAQGRNIIPDAAICSGSRRRWHPRQCGQCGSYPPWPFGR